MDGRGIERNGIMADISDVTTTVKLQVEQSPQKKLQQNKQLTQPNQGTASGLDQRARSQSDVVELSPQARAQAEQAPSSPRETSVVQQDVSGRTPARVPTAADANPQPAPAPSPAAARNDYLGTSAIVDGVTVEQQRAVSVDVTVGGPEIDASFNDTGIVEKTPVPQPSEIIGGAGGAAVANEVALRNQEAQVDQEALEATRRAAELAPAPGTQPAVPTFGVEDTQALGGAEAVGNTIAATAANEQAVAEEVSQANTEAVEQANVEAVRAYEDTQRNQQGDATNRGGPSGFSGGIAINLTV